MQLELLGVLKLVGCGACALLLPMFCRGHQGFLGAVHCCTELHLMGK